MHSATPLTSLVCLRPNEMRFRNHVHRDPPYPLTLVPLLPLVPLLRLGRGLHTSPHLHPAPLVGKGRMNNRLPTPPPCH